MTTRKLTPAEALECLRDWRSTTMSLMDHRRKWGQLELDGLFRIAIAALEEALAQKHPAGKVKPIYAPCGRSFTLESAVWHGGDEDGAGMPSEVVVYGSGDMGAGEVATYRKVQVGENPPASPVPSDEEIVKQIGYVMDSQGDLGELCGALRLLARRIGVQGVPK